jgi:hypothetical protein
MPAGSGNENRIKSKKKKTNKKTSNLKTLTLFIHINNTKYKNRTGSVNREERDLDQVKYNASR